MSKHNLDQSVDEIFKWFLAMKKEKRFRACYIGDVIIDDEYVHLVDTAQMQYDIDKKNDIAMKSFVAWFKNIYLKGISQTLTVIDYSICSKNENESMCLVNRIILNENAMHIDACNVHSKKDEK